jgi:hypothetical protein
MPLRIAGAAVLALAAFTPAQPAVAQDDPFVLVGLVRPQPGQTDPLTVYVSTSGTPPPLAQLERKENWRLLAVTNDGHHEVALDRVKWQEEPNTAMVSLVFPAASVQGLDYAKAGWSVVYLGAPFLTAAIDAPSPGGFKAAKGKDDAAVYAFGSLLIGPSTRPLYVIDLKFEYGKEMQRWTGWRWAAAASASTNTDAKPPVDEVEVDADAIAASLMFTKRVIVNSSWLFGRKYTITPLKGEFSRETFVADAVTSAQLQLNLQPIAHAVTLYPQLGYELGHAIRRPPTISKQPVDLHEWNWIVRAYSGMTGQWTLFKARATGKDWYYVTVTAAYAARFLAQPEPFVENAITDGTRVKVVTVRRNTRHTAEAEFDWNVLKFTSVSLKYKYGADAPLFKLVDHQWTLGVTVKAAQK